LTSVYVFARELQVKDQKNSAGNNQFKASRMVLSAKSPCQVGAGMSFSSDSSSCFKVWCLTPFVCATLGAVGNLRWLGLCSCYCKKSSEPVINCENNPLGHPACMDGARLPKSVSRAPNAEPSTPWFATASPDREPSARVKAGQNTMGELFEPGCRISEADPPSVSYWSMT